MTKERKYEKYITINELEPPIFPEKAHLIAIPIHHDMGINDYAQHFIDVGMNWGAHATGYGEPIVFPNINLKTRSLPHKHAFSESFYFIGIDPDNPDDLGGTVEYWIGEGEEAEPYVFSKPTTLILPPNTIQFPIAYRDIRKMFLTMTILDSPVMANVSIPKIPSGFSQEKLPDETKYPNKKYGHLLNERDVKGLATMASHKGKSLVLLQHDMRQNELTPHTVEVNLIYGSGMGWGCGDICENPAVKTRSLPHRHGVMESYLFIGTDKDNQEDLGGIVEFWIGEGEEAEEYIIDKPTVILIPRNTLHMPIYIRETRNPFVMISVLDTPLMAALPKPVFPPGFKHVVDGKVE